MQINRILLLAAAIFTISACGESSKSSIAGVYACKDKIGNAYTLDIGDGGTGSLFMDKVGKSAAGQFTYTQKGEQVHMSGAGGDMNFTFKDGELKPLSVFTACSKK